MKRYNLVFNHCIRAGLLKFEENCWSIQNNTGQNKTGLGFIENCEVPALVHSFR